MGWSRVTDLVRDLGNANPHSFAAALPAGRILLAVGSNRDTSFRVVTSISHPAVTSAVRIGTQAQANAGSNYDVADIWELTSSGGSGTFQINWNGNPYFAGIVGYQLTDAGSLVGQATQEQTTSQASLQITATGSGATHGLVAALVTNSLANQTNLVAPWNTLVDILTLSNAYHRLVVAAGLGSVSGVTQTITAASGNIALGAARCLLYPDSGGGGGGGGGSGVPLLIARLA
jgi:hypothetical protein